MIENGLGHKLCDPNLNSRQKILSDGLQSCSSRKQGGIESEMLLQWGSLLPLCRGAWASEVGDPDAQI